MAEVEMLDYETLAALFALHGTHYGFHSCYDYIDSLVQDGARYGVVVFVEPIGNLTIWAASWREAAQQWQELFEAQPEDWDYVRAGWHLFECDDAGLPLAWWESTGRNVVEGQRVYLLEGQANG